VYNGKESVPATREYSHESPFYFDGISYDEYFVEQTYRNYCMANKIMVGYKTLRQQIIDGEIDSISDEFKLALPYPENCTAYSELLASSKAKLKTKKRRPTSTVEQRVSAT